MITDLPEGQTQHCAECESLAADLATERLRANAFRDQLAQATAEVVALKGQIEQTLDDAIAAADLVRFSFSREYQRGIDTGTSEMGGNMNWARLGGAAMTVESLRRLAAELRTKSPAPAPEVERAIPDGMVLVPKEPTPEMLLAAHASALTWASKLGMGRPLNQEEWDAGATLRYKAMLDAAPGGKP